MTDLYLKTAAALQTLKNRVTGRAREIAAGESGASLVELVVITAIVLVGCIIIGGVIINALKQQGQSTANCIQQANASDGCQGFAK